MPHSLRLLLCLAAFCLPAAAQGPGKIAWSKDLTTAFETTKAEKKRILMVCVNARYVDGRKTEEPAAKGLREVVYKDPRVVAKSKEFIMAFLTPASSSTEYGELRTVGIEGRMISPQHIFIDPTGKKVLLRKPYWSHGKGEPAVKALLAMMDEAQKKLAGAGGKSVEIGAAPKGDEKPGWISDRIADVLGKDGAKRDAAIEALLKSDEKGDCTTPLILLIEKQKADKDTALLVALVRALGRDGLLDAAPPLAGLLAHRDEKVRGNAAVSLEHIGDRSKTVVAALIRAAGKEKDAAIANHMFRALGRCGKDDGKARSFLLKKCGGSKSEFASYGPAIGLAYFERDKKAARGVEKILKKIGVPGGGRRGRGSDTVKRGVVAWTLAQIGDSKSEKFVQTELVEKLENMQAFWVAPLRGFYRQVVRAIRGEEGALDAVDGGVGGFLSFAKRADPDGYGDQAAKMMDDCRRGRENSGFSPKGENLFGG